MTKYLDENGLKTLVSKIKSTVWGGGNLADNSITAAKLSDDLKSSLGAPFTAVQVNDNKSGSTDAAQLANIKAYAENLKAIGTDITKGYEIPVLYNGGSKGFIGYNPNAKGYYNGYAVTNEGSLYTLTMNSSTGTLTHKILASTDVTDALSNNKQSKTDTSLATANKTIVGAINEINSKSSGAGAYVAFSDITKLNTNLGARLLYTGKDVTLSSPITINENIYEIDFNGKSINLNLTTASGTVSAITGHSHCLIRNLGINGTWTISGAGVSTYILNTFGGIESVDISCSFNCTSIGAAFYPWGIHNANHLINVKVQISDSAASKSSVHLGACYSYCTYLTMCRAAAGSYVSGNGRNFSFFHCQYMDQCTGASGSGLQMNSCSNYTNMDEGGSAYNDLHNITTDKVTYNGYDLTSAVSKISEKNADAYSKTLVHPAGGTGIAEIPIVHDDVTGLSIVRRNDNGRIKATRGSESNDCVTFGQIDVKNYIDYDNTDARTAYLAAEEYYYKHNNSYDPSCNCQLYLRYTIAPASLSNKTYFYSPLTIYYIHDIYGVDDSANICEFSSICGDSIIRLGYNPDLGDNAYYWKKDTLTPLSLTKSEVDAFWNNN